MGKFLSAKLIGTGISLMYIITSILKEHSGIHIMYTPLKLYSYVVVIGTTLARRSSAGSPVQHTLTRLGSLTPMDERCRKECKEGGREG